MLGRSLSLLGRKGVLLCLNNCVAEEEFRWRAKITFGVSVSGDCFFCAHVRAWCPLGSPPSSSNIHEQGSPIPMPGWRGRSAK